MINKEVAPLIFISDDPNTITFEVVRFRTPISSKYLRWEQNRLRRKYKIGPWWMRLWWIIREKFIKDNYL